MLIQEFKDQEKQKLELIEKVRQRDAKIQKLNELIDSIQNGVKSKNDSQNMQQKIKDLEEQNQQLLEDQN